MQNDARRVMLFLDAFVLQKPEVCVGNVAGKFDAQGRCIDAAMLRCCTFSQMAAFVCWMGRVKRMTG